MERRIFIISVEAHLKVLALSVKTLEGSPRLAANLLKASKKDGTDKLSTRSRWIARVEAHVNRLFFHLINIHFWLDKYNGFTIISNNFSN